MEKNYEDEIIDFIDSDKLMTLSSERMNKIILFIRKHKIAKSYQERLFNGRIKQQERKGKNKK